MNRQERRAKKARNRKMKGAGQSLATVTQKAKKLHQAGRLEQAEKLYRRVIRASPNHADALNYLGILLHQTNRGEDAVRVLKKCTSVSPDYADAHNNLGLVLKELECYEEAAAAFDDCLKHSPNHVNALNNYGTVYRAKKDFEKAIEFYNRAIELDGEYSDAYINLGYSLRKLSRMDEAVDAYLTAIRLRPYDSAAYNSLGRMLYAENRVEEATELFRQWLELDPDNPTARHMYAACSGENIPARASDGYIIQAFNSFANTFDTVLKNLDYSAPQLVADAVERCAESGQKQFDILDAGCGTGLVAPLVKDHAKTLTGVDLSPEMVNRARGLDIYTDLHVEELCGFMNSHPNGFDMVLAVDTLIYFGDLEEVFKAAHQALRPNGRVIFTVERIVDPVRGENIRLNPHGRYSHEQRYLANCLNANGFELKLIDKANLRMEAGEPVEGLIVVASRNP